MGNKEVKKIRSATAQADRELEKRLAVLNTLLDSIQAKMTSNAAKPSMGDFIRLLQLRKELEAEIPREIRVSWLETEL
jgi:hypothetical protein